MNPSTYAMAGPAMLLGLAFFGSAIGCAIGFSAAQGVMARTDEGHGKFIGMAAAPSSQTVFAFIMMNMMRSAILEGTLAPLSAIFIGVSAGLAIFSSSVFQGKVVAAAIQSVAKQPSLFGKSFVGIGIIESFSILALVFFLQLLK
ncbi:MAG: ATP synthase subunit C [Chlamydiia bacterium]